MQFEALINIMPLKELLDPQGKTVEQSLHNMSFNMDKVRIGKHITLIVEANHLKEAQAKVDEACKKLLHNPVMEYYEFEINALD